MIEALLLGIMIYYGSEIGEYTHRQFDQFIESKQEQKSDLGSGTFIILDEDGNVLFEQKIGENNE